MTRVALCLMPAIFAVYIPTCTPPVRATMGPWDAPLAKFWRRPRGLPTGDLYSGPWGPEHAPDPNDTYTFVRLKDGTNPGVTVMDSEAREWHVKQPPQNDQGAGGPIEVVLSRVLSAVGYHQPPVYVCPPSRRATRRGRIARRAACFC